MSTDNGQQSTVNGQWSAMSYEQFCPKLAARCSLPVALGIAAASFWSVAENEIRERKMGFGNGDLGARRNEAEKDIAESPARSERPR